MTGQHGGIRQRLNFSDNPPVQAFESCLPPRASTVLLPVPADQRILCYRGWDCGSRRDSTENTQSLAAWSGPARAAGLFRPSSEKPAEVPPERAHMGAALLSQEQSENPHKLSSRSWHDWGLPPRSMAFAVLDEADMQGRFCASLNRRRETMSVSEMALVGASCAWLAVASQQLPKVRNTSAAKSLTCEHGVLGLQALLVPSLRR